MAASQPWLPQLERLVLMVPFLLPRQRQAALRKLLPRLAMLPRRELPQQQGPLRQQQVVLRAVIPILVHSYVSIFLENSNYNLTS